MSGVLHSIGHVFSEVWDFIRPVVEVVAAAVAVYFTAGLALGYFSPAMAAALPGFAGAAGPGTGFFTTAASAIGDTGIAQAGADATLADTAGISAVTASAPAVTATDASAALPETTAVGESVEPVATTLPATANTTAIAAAPAVNASVASAAGSGAAAGASSLTDKLLLASVAGQTISGLTQPSPTDIAQAKATFYGAFYGENANGSGVGMPDLSVGPQTQPGQTPPTSSAQSLTPGINAPATQNVTNYLTGATPTSSATAAGSAPSAATPQASLIPVSYAAPKPVSAPTPTVAQPNVQVQSATAGARAPQLIPSAPTAPAVPATQNPTTTPA